MTPEKLSYEDDLRRRLKEARELIAANEGKKVGPYLVSAEMFGQTWAHIVEGVLRMARAVERGPEHFITSTWSSAGEGQAWSVKSGDEIDPNHRSRA